jgi:hypothetical protein
MAGHQLTFLPELKEIRKRGISYMNSMRTAAIPRTEGAILSLAVHDVAVLQYVSGCRNWDIEHVNGNAHTAYAQLSGKERNAPLPTAEIYVAAFSHIRLRTTTFVDQGHGIHQLGVDNWNRRDLLKSALEEFCACIRQGRAPKQNGLEETCAVMNTVLNIQEALEGK